MKLTKTYLQNVILQEIENVTRARRRPSRRMQNISSGGEIIMKNPPEESIIDYDRFADATLKLEPELDNDPEIHAAFKSKYDYEHGKYISINDLNDYLNEVMDTTLYISVDEVMKFLKD